MLKLTGPFEIMIEVHLNYSPEQIYSAVDNNLIMNLKNKLVKIWNIS